MVMIPELKNYSIEKLSALGNASQDAFFREEIKELIVKKILMLHSPMFFLINKFDKSSKILREVYAKTILIRMKDEDYEIDDSVVDEILSLVSLEDLALYGSDVKSLNIREKCNKLIWDSVVIFEDTSEMDKKNARYRRRVLVEKLKMEG